MGRQLRTNGYIARLLQSKDKGTIMRKQNLRRYAKENGIYNCFNMFNRTTYIDLNGVLFELNPSGETENDLVIPRLRTLEQCVELLIKEFPQYHLNEHRIHLFFFNHDNFFKYFYGNKWIVNYDELKLAVGKLLDKNSN